MLKLFNINFVLETFNFVFSLNLHIYKPPALSFIIFWVLNKNPNFMIIFISRFKTISKLFFHTFVYMYIYYKMYTYNMSNRNLSNYLV